LKIQNRAQTMAKQPTKGGPTNHTVHHQQPTPVHKRAQHHHNHQQQQQVQDDQAENRLNAMSQQQQQQQQQPKLQKSARKSARLAPKSITSSAYSPPLHQTKSKFSKSKRFDPHEVPPVSCCDYLLLLIYYICLYAFYAAFWYALWMIYIATTNANAPRVPHNRSAEGQFTTNDTRTNFAEYDLVVPAKGSKRLGPMRVNTTKLLMSLTDEQRQALSAIKCSDTLNSIPVAN
jgi:hypothetical protein